jgi:threonine dehydrogenase-like Zn-dependent dehydrogenase
LQAILDLTNSEGVQVAIEAVGLPQTYRLAVEAVAFAGRVVYVGYAKQNVSFDTTLFVKKELDVLGSRNALDVFPAVLEMLENKERPFPDLVTRVFPFAQTADALSYWDSNPAEVHKIQIELS